VWVQVRSFIVRRNNFYFKGAIRQVKKYFVRCTKYDCAVKTEAHFQLGAWSGSVSPAASVFNMALERASRHAMLVLLLHDLHQVEV
jgi:hypothetical protein